MKLHTDQSSLQKAQVNGGYFKLDIVIWLEILC